MAIDRNAALKQAEKLLRQGKLDGAIQEYVRLIEDQPRDWNSMNALGDLYARADNTERAVEQFTRVADHLFAEGFFPKAAALYKKALKTRSDHEHSLSRLGEIAAQQGLVADAKLYLGLLAKQRRARGDERGADECLVRLSAMDDPELKLAGARAARALNNSAQAAALFSEAAEGLEKQERKAAALDARVEWAQLDTAEPQLRARVALECAAAGQLDRARLFLTLESAGEDPDLLLAVGRMELEGGSEEQARGAFSRLMVVAPDRAPAVMRAAEKLLDEGRTDAAYGCVDVVTETALVAGDFEGALGALQSFLRRGPHIPALMKLVEIAVDMGRADVLFAAQGQLADAYLAASRGSEARVIAEDLVAHDPTSEPNVQRLRRALALVGAPDAELIVARHVNAASLSDESLDLDEPADAGLSESDVLDEPELVVETASEIHLRQGFVAEESPDASDHSSTESDVTVDTATGDSSLRTRNSDQDVSENTEVDLSEALGNLSSSVPFLPPPAVTEPAHPPKPLESVFEGMRAVALRDQAPVPDGLLERGLEHLEQGRSDEGISDLRSAARTPMLRFTAAARLGRLYASRGELQEAVEWLERAADAPPPSSEESVAVLYDLAGALERMGESARALAVLIEIDADAGAYLDVRERIEQLTRAQAGSHSS